MSGPDLLIKLNPCSSILKPNIRGSVRLWPLFWMTKCHGAAQDNGNRTAMTLSSLKRPLVLVVDDDPIIRLLARQTLEPDGFTIAEADDGTTAIDFFTKQLPDVASFGC